MPDKRPTQRAPSTLSFKIGRWMEATATGWGIVALMVLALAMIGGAIAGESFY